MACSSSSTLSTSSSGHQVQDTNVGSASSTTTTAAAAEGGSRATRATAAAAGYRVALVALTFLFFMWGFITCLNDILIPHLKAALSLSYTQAMLVQFAFFSSYFLVSLPAGALVHRVGYKKGILVGLVVAACGCGLFYPAAGAVSYGLFLTALFVLAAGITVLQVSANPYVAVLGPAKTASSRLNLTQAFNSLGTTLAPLFGTLLILSAAGTSTGAGSAAAVQKPYLILAGALLAVAALIALVKLPRIAATSTANSSHAGTTDTHDTHRTSAPAALATLAAPPKSAWGYRHLVLGAIAIFLYVGGEVSIGSFLVNFMGQENIAGLPEHAAGKFLSFYWGGAMVGRFIGAFVLQRLAPGKVLAFNAAASAALVLAAMLGAGHFAMWSLLAVGLFNSIMFPTIFTLGVRDLGKHTSQGSGILCMAIVGGALVPLLQAAFADRIGIQHALFVPMICYAYIAFYGLKGHHHRSVAGAPA